MLFNWGTEIRFRIIAGRFKNSRFYCNNNNNNNNSNNVAARIAN